MASLQEVLAQIPGLAGYQAQVNANQQQGMNTLQMAQGAGSLMSLVQQQEARRQAMQEAEAMKGIMAQTGGDPALAVPALIKMGTPTAVKLASELKAFMPKPAEPFTLTPGAQRFDASGKPIATGPAAPYTLAPGARRIGPNGEILAEAPNRPTVTQPSSLGRMIAERDALPPNDPNRAYYNRAIDSASKNAGSGVNVTVSPTLQLGKAGQTKVDEGILDTTSGLMRLSAIEAQFKPEYQQIAPRISAAWTSLKEKAGVGASPQDTKFLTEFSAYKRNAINSMNEYIKSITGAAMSEPEAQRILKGMPNAGQGIFDGDSPTEFKAKMDDAITQTKRAIARYTYIKQRGMKMTDEAGNATIPLDKMPQVMNDRGKELEAQIKKGSPNIPAANLARMVRGMLSKEFGLIQ